MDAPILQSPTNIGGITSSYVDNTLPIVHDSSKCSSSSKKHRMAALDELKRAPLESSYLRQKQNQFMVYLDLPVRKRENLTKRKLVTCCRCESSIPHEQRGPQKRFFPKKDGTLRCWGGFRGHNEMTTWDS